MSRAASKSKATVERWNVHQRLQHILLVVATSVLILTGFPIKYHALPWAHTVTGWVGGFESLFALHLAAAVLLILTSVYHVVYLLVYWRKQGPSWAMVPRWRDLRDAWHHALHLIGLRREAPHFDRYTYMEKFEYLAVFWGMAFMGGSGLALWFPVQAARILPRWGLEAIRVIHSNEAFIAMLALAFGHFFAVHFHPSVFPNSQVWLSGRISLNRLAEEHPAELDQLVSAGKISAEVAATARQHQEIHRPLMLWVELALYGAVFAWLLLTFVPMLFA
ncbi:MAG: formate dehydrogenase subunit gamma [Symbiobacteriia bacterium]